MRWWTVLLVLAFAVLAVFSQDPNELKRKYKLAYKKYEAGDFVAARDLLEDILKVVSQGDVESLLGHTYIGLNDYQNALIHMKKSVELNPESQSNLLNLVVILSTSEVTDMGEAERYMKKLLELNPRDPNYHRHLASLQRLDDRPTESLKTLENANRLFPGNAEILNEIGVWYALQKRFEESLDWLEKSDRANSNNLSNIRDLVEVLMSLKRYDEAAIECERGLRMNPNHESLVLMRAKLYKKSKEFAKAEEYFVRTIELSPQCVDCLINVGMFYCELHRIGQYGMLEKAREVLSTAVNLEPNNADALMNFGFVLSEMMLYDEAVMLLEEVKKLRPSYMEAYLNQAFCLDHAGRGTDALRTYGQAFRMYLGLSPDDPSVPDTVGAMSVSVHAEPSVWEDFNAASYFITKIIRAELDFDRGDRLSPRSMISVGAKAQREIAELWIRKMGLLEYDIMFNMPFFKHDRFTRPRNDKIRIGYLGNDFRGEHPMCHLISEFFYHHDKSRFETFAYSAGRDDGSTCRDYIVKHVDHFTDIQQLNDADVAKMVYEDNIDILVDLPGHTTSPRIGVLAFTPAPVQAHYMGSPFSIGAPFIDYYIGDTVVVPMELTPHFTEKLVNMPHGYWVQGDVNLGYIPPKSEENWPKSIPKDVFVFTSFNQAYKLEPVVYSVWMNILTRVPNSVLWLYPVSEESERNLHLEAAARGINPSRIIFPEKVSKEDHLSRLQYCDLMIDAFVYNGHTTMSDALLMGIPGVTVPMDTMARRVAAGLLISEAENDFIAGSIPQFEDLAVEIALDTLALEETKARLVEKHAMHSVPLMDTELFTRDLERAYTRMYNRWLAGLEPDHIHVPPVDERGVDY